MINVNPELHHQVRRAMAVGSNALRDSMARLHEAGDSTEELWRLLIQASQLRYVDAPQSRAILQTILQHDLIALAPLARVSAEHYLFLIDSVYHAVDVDHAGFDRLRTEYREVSSAFGEALVELNHGYAHLIVHRPLQAVAYLHRALDAFDALGDVIMMGHTKIQIAGALVHSTILHGADDDAIKRALQLLQEVYDTFAKADLEEFLVEVLGRISNIYLVESDYASALSSMHKALAICERIPLSQKTSEQLLETTDCLNQIAQIHAKARNLDVARTYALQALEVCPDSYVSACNGALAQLGVIETWDGNDDLALQYYLEAQDHALAHGLQVDAVQYYNVAHSHLRLGHPNEARAAAEMARGALKMGQHADAWSTIVEAQILLQDGEYEAAARSIRDFLDHQANSMMIWEQIEAHLVLRDVALKQNDLQQYVLHNERSATLTEELRGSKKLLGLSMKEQERALDAEREEARRHRSILYSTLPKHIADRVARGESVNDHYDSATVIFLDIVGFTTFSDRYPSSHVVNLLDKLFSMLDRICAAHNVVKIKTIGDSYMAAAFPADPSHSELGAPVHRAAMAALEMMQAVASVDVEDLLGFAEPAPAPLRARIGMHCGPLTAGVIGTDRLQYDVWGDTVNVASRMESTSEPGRIQVSDAFARALCLVPSASGDVDQAPGTRHQALTERGEVNIKGKGTMKTFWLEGA